MTVIALHMKSVAWDAVYVVCHMIHIGTSSPRHVLSHLVDVVCRVMFGLANELVGASRLCKHLCRNRRHIQSGSPLGQAWLRKRRGDDAEDTCSCIGTTICSTSNVFREVADF